MDTLFIKTDARHTFAHYLPYICFEQSWGLSQGRREVPALRHLRARHMAQLCPAALLAAAVNQVTGGWGRHPG